jgi:hypothetical protein
MKMGWFAFLCFLGVAWAQGPLTPCGDQCMSGILSVNPNANQQSCSDTAVQNAFGNCVVDQQCTDTLVRIETWIHSKQSRTQFTQLCQGRFSAQSQPSPDASAAAPPSPSPSDNVENSTSAAPSNGPLMALMMVVLLMTLA